MHCWYHSKSFQDVLRLFFLSSRCKISWEKKIEWNVSTQISVAFKTGDDVKLVTSDLNKDSRNVCLPTLVKVIKKWRILS